MCVPLGFSDKPTSCFTINKHQKMKKILFCACALLLSAAAYADGTKTCRVKGTDGSVEVSVTVDDAETGTCTLYFSNDTDKNVNVRYEVTCNNGPTIPGAQLVYANSQGYKNISFRKKVIVSQVYVSTLTGEKCE